MLLSGLALACSASTDTPSTAGQAEGACGVLLNPGEGLEAVTEKWAQEWAVATGCDVRVDALGIPVTFVDEARSEEDGHLTCAGTDTVRTPEGEYLRTKSVRVDRTPPDGCVGWGYSVGHEIAHAMGARGHTPDPTSLLASDPDLGVVHTVDASAVAWVCSQVACP